MIFERLIGERKAGFVFLRENFASGKVKSPHEYASPDAFLAQMRKVVASTVAAKPGAGEREKRKDVMAFSRKMGQIPEQRIHSSLGYLTPEKFASEYREKHSASVVSVDALWPHRFRVQISGRTSPAT